MSSRCADSRLPRILLQLETWLVPIKTAPPNVAPRWPFPVTSITCILYLSHYPALAWPAAKVVSTTRTESPFIGDAGRIMCTPMYPNVANAPIMDLKWGTTDASDHPSCRTPWVPADWHFGTVSKDLKLKSTCCYRNRQAMQTDTRDPHSRHQSRASSDSTL